jgi:uncharacterized protein (TIGR00255 family)
MKRGGEGDQQAIRGMTGYGQAIAEGAGRRVEVELKGLNHRFLDVKIRLPAELGALESALRARVQPLVQRGRLDVTVTVVAERPLAARVEINRPLVAAYLKAAAVLKKEFRLRGTPGLDAVTALPGAIVIQPEDGGPQQDLQALVEQALDRALRVYDAMRLDEGRRLTADIRDRLQAIAAMVDRIEAEGRDLPARYADRLRERVAALTRDRPLDDTRLAQEVALLADRVDISEEVVRLRGYVEQARATIDRPAGAVGKSLDFIMQEMHREANTISSKAEALAICQEALRVKAEVEKIREQVQNLE